MLHFIVASHGPLATALISSANMVYGQLDNTTPICLTEEGGIEKFKQDFHQEISAIAPNVDGIVVLCDLECGTPYNVACTYAFNHKFITNVEVVTGVNFPTLLMTADFIEHNNASEVAETLRAEALNTVVVAKPVELVEEEDF
ncbi:PTS systemmannose-specific IIA component /PTS systemmannose-specific IIB component [Vibrio maritimus]|uniref:PTS systemmannose-specific IIA component /PTS systemmannose-specific IIB component n=1 Tax=Vibrio maritimus TaxID=990268 RepID=A0A090RRG8_9VIBR|nr:PTS systemmannose-specific IIA component /PTS systemmannose-specific IIB component [Vibrio maritimus]